MNKSIPNSGANAVKIIWKNKEAFEFNFKNKAEGSSDVTYTFEVSYETYYGTFNFRMKQDEFLSATLNLTGLKKVITLDNDANLLKLCEYVWEKYNK
ncbi:MAG: hypothetical protein RSC10_06890 [Longicatena sp.]